MHDCEFHRSPQPRPGVAPGDASSIHILRDAEPMLFLLSASSLTLFTSVVLLLLVCMYTDYCKLITYLLQNTVSLFSYV